MWLTRVRAPVAISTRLRPPSDSVPCRAKQPPSGRQLLSAAGGKEAHLLPGILSTAVHSVLAFFASRTLKIPANSSSGAGCAEAEKMQHPHKRIAIPILGKIVRTYASPGLQAKGVP